MAKRRRGKVDHRHDEMLELTPFWASIEVGHKRDTLGGDAFSCRTLEEAIQFLRVELKTLEKLL